MPSFGSTSTRVQSFSKLPFSPCLRQVQRVVVVSAPGCFIYLVRIYSFVLCFVCLLCESRNSILGSCLKSLGTCLFVFQPLCNAPSRVKPSIHYSKPSLPSARKVNNPVFSKSQIGVSTHSLCVYFVGTYISNSDVLPFLFLMGNKYIRNRFASTVPCLCWDVCCSRDLTIEGLTQERGRMFSQIY